MNRVTKIASILGLLLTATAEARVLDYGDAQRVADEVVKEMKADEILITSVDSQLNALQLYPAQKAHIRKALFTRILTEARNTALALESSNYPDREAAKADVMKQVRVYRFNALTDPKGYANGRKTAYRVTDDEAKRLARGLLATYIEREMPLRERLDEMVLMEEIQQEDVASVRALAREASIERGQRAIREMRGMAFFTAYDAQSYLEYEIEAEIDSIRGDRLGDPLNRVGFVQEAKERFPHGTTTSGFNGVREDESSPRLAETKKQGSASTGLRR